MILFRKMRKKIFHVLLIFLLSIAVYKPLIAQTTIGEIPLPSADYHRLPAGPGSFAAWLRQRPLKNKNLPVLDYRGRIFKAAGDSVVAAVLDLDIKGRRLEQCMDILVRLYADYLWQNKQGKDLILPLPGGYWLTWADWKKGFRPIFKGIEVRLFLSAQADSGEMSYKKYLNTVFAESHTQQFYHAYKPITPEMVAVGDFIVKKGTKGHAVLIADMAVNEHGDLIALVGNGDTPACQFFLINYKKDEAWIPLDFERENLLLPLRRKMSWDGLRRFNLIRGSD